MAPEQSGTGLGALGYALKHVAGVGRAVGGSGSLPDALAASVEAHGGCIRTNAPVARVLVEGNHVRGVMLSDGSTLTAITVVTAIDPRQVMVDWLANPPPCAQAIVERWRTGSRRDGYESKIDAVLRSRPTYRNLDERHFALLGVGDPLAPTTIVAPSP